MSLRKISTAACLVFASIGIAAAAQAPRLSGTVKSASADSVTVTTAAGKDVVVAVPATAKVLLVAPGSTDLKSATVSTAADIASGDKVLITGTAGDDASAIHAVRVIVMKSTAIAESHAAEVAAWQHGAGGLVKAVNPDGSIAVMSGARVLTVQTSPATIFKRYSGDSVRFEDATASKFSDIRPGDQLRVRGTRSEDGGSIQAEAIVTGSFRNFSGLLTAVDGAAGTVTLTDLATKKKIVVKVSANSDLRRLPAQAAARFAARAAGSSVGPAGTAPGSSGAAASGPGGNGRAGADLSQMLSRLPTETLGGLKPGDAVMIVATQPPSDSSEPIAVTLLAGVEPILQASPKGETVLSPWSGLSGAPDGAGMQ